MENRKTLTIIGLAGTILMAPAALAATQGDVVACRAAMTTQSPDVLEGFRLRFKKERGFQNRVISFEAIPNKPSAGPRFNVTCYLNQKNIVLAINTHKAVKYVLNK